jgi:uncharacterized protein involved in exopolysaccharide biosynthesis
MNTEYQDTALSIFDFLKAIKDNFKFIFVITSLGFILTASYSLLVQEIYTSTALLQANINQKGGANTRNNSLTGIAEMAGIGPGSTGVTPEHLAYQKLKSKEFFEILYNDDRFIANIFAYKTYQKKNNNDIYSSSYDDESSKWLVPKPIFQEAYHYFHQDYLTVIDNVRKGTTEIRISHPSPVLAAKLLQQVISEVNKFATLDDKAEAKRSLDYLKDQSSKTILVEVKKVLASLIQTEVQTLMMTEVSNEYLYKVIDKPYEPFYRSYPKKSQMVVIGTISSTFIAIVFSLYAFINRKTPLEIVKKIISKG